MLVTERLCTKRQTVSGAAPYYHITMEETLIPESRYLDYVNLYGMIFYLVTLIIKE